ncbi:MAG: hypothetical protein P1P88_25375, partial [Bacteroidales bacterium]|nr:hypothetical protein [Bacteroidales bacterium]
KTHKNRLDFALKATNDGLWDWDFKNDTAAVALLDDQYRIKQTYFLVNDEKLPALFEFEYINENQFYLNTYSFDWEEYTGTFICRIEYFFDGSDWQIQELVSTSARMGGLIEVTPFF